MTGTRAAVYGRYSSELQNDQSIEDQFRLCRDFAARNGFTVVAQYSDAAKSGSSLFGRDGAIDLSLDGNSGKFDIVVVESLDRLSRDQEDLAKLYKRFSFKGVKIVAVSGGVADEVQVGIRGLLGSLYLKDLAERTLRTRQGAVSLAKLPPASPLAARLTAFAQ
jgi:site-specific DNA recombinase